MGGRFASARGQAMPFVDKVGWGFTPPSDV